jgi:hypothetical protein
VIFLPPCLRRYAAVSPVMPPPIMPMEFIGLVNKKGEGKSQKENFFSKYYASECLMKNYL